MYYYKTTDSFDSVFITQEPMEIENTVEITEEDYATLVAARREED